MVASLSDEDLSLDGTFLALSPGAEASVVLDGLEGQVVTFQAVVSAETRIGRARVEKHREAPRREYRLVLQPEEKLSWADME